MKTPPQDLVQPIFLLLPLYFELYAAVGDRFTGTSQGWTFPLRFQKYQSKVDGILGGGGNGVEVAGP